MPDHRLSSDTFEKDTPVPIRRSPLVPPALAAFRLPLFALVSIFASAAVSLAAPPVPEEATCCWDALSEGIGPQDTRLASVRPSIAAHGKDHLWLAWSEEAAMQVRRWLRGKWVKVPAPAGREPVVRVAANGDAYLAWYFAKRDQSDVYVARWDGSAWKPVGPPLSAYPEPATNAGNAAMALDGKGRPVVAWQEADGTGPRSLHVARWDGRKWAALGKSVAAGSTLYSLEPCIAVDPKDSVLVAWKGGTKAHSFIRVARWTGTDWQDMGNTGDGVLRGGDDVRGPQLVPLSGERLLLAWLESGAQRGPLAYSRWTGTRWDEARPVPGTTGARRQSWLPSLVRLDDGTAMLAWPGKDGSDFYSVFAKRWAGDSWRDAVGGLHLDAGPSSATDVALAPAPGGGFFAAWDEPDRKDRRTRVVRAHPCAPAKCQAVAPKRPRSSYWPKTVDAAVDNILATMDDKSKAQVRSTPRRNLARFHLGWGTGIRNEFGLWAGNTALLESCGGKRIHPDDCSMIIIERVWDRLQNLPPAASR